MIKNKANKCEATTHVVEVVVVDNNVVVAVHIGFSCGQ